MTSLNHDTRVMRESKGTPQDANIYGYVYNIDTDELSLVVEDKGLFVLMPRGGSMDEHDRRPLRELGDFATKSR